MSELSKTAENLTDDEREFLRAARALRIIDAQAAVIERVQAVTTRWERVGGPTGTDSMQAISDALAAARDHALGHPGADEVFARLQARRAAPEHTADEPKPHPLAVALDAERTMLAAANARAEAAERDRDVWRRRSHEGTTPELDAAESKLSDAIALLEAADSKFFEHDWWTRRRKFLDAKHVNTSRYESEAASLRLEIVGLRDQVEGAELAESRVQARAEAAEQETRRTAKQSADNFRARERAESEAAALRAEVAHKRNLLDMRTRETEDLRVSLKATEDNYHELTLEAASLRAELAESEGFRSAMRGQLDRYKAAGMSACAREMRDQLQHQGASNTQEDDLERWAFSFDAIQALRVEAESEVEKLRAERNAAYDVLRRLARFREVARGTWWSFSEWDAIMADAPAFTHRDAEPFGPADRRAEADRKVLHASSAVADGALRWLLGGGVSVDLQDWASAELARRVVAK